MRKPAFCICENKDADQLRGNREADQRLCFRYIASTIPLLPKYYVPPLFFEKAGDEKNFNYHQIHTIFYSSVLNLSLQALLSQ